MMLEPLEFELLCSERPGVEDAVVRVVEDYQGPTVGVYAYETAWYNPMTESWVENRDYLSSNLQTCHEYCVDRCDTVIAFQSSDAPDAATTRACRYAYDGMFSDKPFNVERDIIDHVQPLLDGAKAMLIVWDIDKHPDRHVFASRLRNWLRKENAETIFIAGSTDARMMYPVYDVLMRTFRLCEDANDGDLHTDMFHPSLGIEPKHFIHIPSCNTGV